MTMGQTVQCLNEMWLKHEDGRNGDVVTNDNRQLFFPIGITPSSCLGSIEKGVNPHMKARNSLANPCGW